MSRLNLVALLLSAILIVALPGCSEAVIEPRSQVPSSQESSDRSIQGCVFTETIYPTQYLDNAEVTLANGRVYRSALTDSSGQYAMRNLPPGQYVLYATAGGCDTTTIFLSLLPHERREINLCVNITERFHPGDVLMGLTDTTMLRTVLHVSDSLQIGLTDAYYFRHSTTPLPPDSARRVASYLAVKTYLKVFPPRLDEHGDSSTVVVDYFYRMTREDFSDWMVTRASLGLIESPSRGKWVVLRVPVGTELEWIRELKKLVMVRCLTPNFYGR